MFSSNTSAVSGDAVYIEDVFSTWLYTGNDATQAASTGINLSTKGGLVWTKRRNGAASHFLVDTVRGNNKPLSSNSTAAQTVAGVDYITPTTTGYTVENVGNINTTGETYASWTFAKQAKFFDVVTYTGDGNSSQTINHNLGSAPGCIIIKRTDSTSDWFVGHRFDFNSVLRLNTTAAKTTLAWDSFISTATNFRTGSISGSPDMNVNGATYVAYLFAHDAGGFGLTGTDNVISCGSYTGNGSSTGPVVTLGYEPQWVLIKNASAAQTWYLVDAMRGMVVGDADAALNPNTSNAEAATTILSPTATGFQIDTAGSPNQSGNTFIYIAIRRGPMKTPTTGTSVYTSSTGTNSATIPTFTANFPVDWIFAKNPAATFSWEVAQRLTGGYGLAFNSTAAQSGPLSDYVFDSNIGAWTNYPNTFRSWMFRRAPGFFDVVCYTGTSSGMTISHNLGATPQIVILKCRDAASSWFFWSNGLTSTNYKMRVNLNEGQSDEGASWISVSSSSVTLANGYFTTNNNVMYLFATVAGVSKVGSYTGTGALQTINCGFTGGARFVLIKRTDSTGDWWVYDSARGISSGNDPYLLLNSTAAEVTGTNYVDTASTGFQVTAAAPAGLNANGGTYIFLAIA